MLCCSKRLSLCARFLYARIQHESAFRKFYCEHFNVRYLSAGAADVRRGRCDDNKNIQNNKCVRAMPIMHNCEKDMFYCVNKIIGQCVCIIINKNNLQLYLYFQDLTWFCYIYAKQYENLYTDIINGILLYVQFIYTYNIHTYIYIIHILYTFLLCTHVII